MKAITLYQPFATLCMLGVKPDETRSWPTIYRGPLAIHAAKNEPKWCHQDYLRKDIWWLLVGTALSEKRFGAIEMMLVWRYLPRGVMMGTVDLTDCVPAAERRRQLDVIRIKVTDHRKSKIIRIKQSDLGDYSEGRFAWRLENPLLFDRMIPARGRQRVWEWDAPMSTDSGPNERIT